jgi:fructose-bisphosphate aldolase class II
MPLVPMTEMLKKAKTERYAVGQFNLNNLEFTQAILQAAQEENSPVILGVSEGAARYMSGFKTIVKMVEGLRIP